RSSGEPPRSLVPCLRVWSSRRRLDRSPVGRGSSRRNHDRTTARPPRDQELTAPRVAGADLAFRRCVPRPPTKDRSASRGADVRPEHRCRTFIRAARREVEFRTAAWLLLGVALLFSPPVRADVRDPNFYAASLDTDVSYDSALAGRYDD